MIKPPTFWPGPAASLPRQHPPRLQYPSSQPDRL